MFAEIQNDLQAEADLQLAYLFGSAATDTMRPDSDIDVAVAAGEPLDAPRMMALIARLGDLTGRDVDLVDLNQAHGTILKEAMQGKELFCRDYPLKEKLMKRLVYEQEDFMPLRRRLLARRRQLELHGHE
jgi:predicted nucleotidyltransferase